MDYGSTKKEEEKIRKNQVYMKGTTGLHKKDLQVYIKRTMGLRKKNPQVYIKRTTGLHKKISTGLHKKDYGSA